MLHMDHKAFRKGLPAWNDKSPDAAAAVLRGLVETDAVTVEVEHFGGRRYIIDFAGTPADSSEIAVRLYADLNQPGDVARWLNVDPRLIHIFPAGTSKALALTEPPETPTPDQSH